MDLQPELALFLGLAKAYATRLEGDRNREPIYVFSNLGSAGPELQHHALTLPADLQWDEEMLTRLDEKGLIRLDYSGTSTRSITVTPDGERLAEQLERASDTSEPDPDDAVNLDWGTVALPALRKTYELWVKAGAPEGGIPTVRIAQALSGDDADPQSFRVVSLLVEAGRLSSRSALSANDAPMLVAVTSDGLEMVAGWPSTTGEAATAALLAALDERIADTDDPEEKGRLKKLKQSALDVGRETLTDVIAKVLSGGVTG